METVRRWELFSYYAKAGEKINFDFEVIPVAAQDTTKFDWRNNDIGLFNYTERQWSWQKPDGNNGFYVNDYSGSDSFIQPDYNWLVYWCYRKRVWKAHIEGNHVFARLHE